MELINSWLGEVDGKEIREDENISEDDNELGRLCPAMAATLNSSNILFTSAHQYSAQQTLMPLMGLAKWATMYPISPHEDNRNVEYGEHYARLHSGVLECLNDVLERRSVNIAVIIMVECSFT